MYLLRLAPQWFTFTSLSIECYFLRRLVLCEQKRWDRGGGLVHPEGENSIIAISLLICLSNLQLMFLHNWLQSCVQLGAGKPNAPFMLIVHSPDDIFMVLASIFISKTHNYFCILCFRLAAARTTIALCCTEILNTIHWSCMFVQTYGCTTLSLCLSTLVARQNWSLFVEAISLLLHILP